MFAEPLPTRCPYTFRDMDPAATESPYVDPQEYPLPEGWQNSGVITFAMAGARTSGKSVYMAIVVKLLKHLCIEYGGAFDYANDATRESYHVNYEAPLFGLNGESRRVLGATRPAESPEAYQHRPLIFRLGRHTLANGTTQNIFVVFRDVAGEDLEAMDFESRMPYLDFFQHVDSVIYLYDPLAVPEIRDLLAGSVPMDAVSTAEPVAVLKNVVRAIGPHRPEIALTLAKFDIMQEIPRLNLSSTAAISSDSIDWKQVMDNLGAAFRRAGSRYAKPYDAADAELLHQETHSMLLNLRAREMFNVLNQPILGIEPHDYRCYVVSSLGASPTGEHIDDSGIAPFRLLDPLRAQFNKLGLFQ
ncbi:hypothetical protein [Corynebacterium cystitidis]|uniref:hypothetical protein n=1 Tax=Corynebacterium cystitidis TaxID=35757 RepID=UPI00211E53CC|nr:hypothetical protein [Corynebacterium cystitidis]